MQRHYDYSCKSMTLKYDFTEEDLKILYPQIKKFKQSHNRNPEKNQDDE